MLKKIMFFTAIAAITTLPLGKANAADPANYTIEMKGGKFSPATLEIPAGKKIHLTVKNEESVQTEFESYKLDKEEKIESGKSVDMFVGPLEAGEYPIFDDNNPDATGKIVAK